MPRIAVLGAGAWGTSIAVVLSARLEVALWAQKAEQAQAIGATRRNERYLPGVEIPKSIAVTSDLSKAVSRAQLVLAATPVAGLRDVLQKLDAPVPLV
jgi:glycerol-3-phosphate dehydrogenase (NAD(P)+)